MIELNLAGLLTRVIPPRGASSNRPLAALALIHGYGVPGDDLELPAELSPRSGHRLYRRKEVVLLLEIKQLLYDKRYTIEGAKLYLKGRGKQERRERSQPPLERQGSLFGYSPAAWEEVRKELASILETLK